MKAIPKWLYWIVCIGIAATLIAIRVWPTPQDGARKASSGQRTQKVTTITIHAETFSEEVISTGTLRAFESIDIQVEVSGKLRHIGFVEGCERRFENPPIWPV